MASWNTHLLLPMLLLSACAESNTTADTPASDTATTVAQGSCTYTNRFSRSPECRNYTGAGWTSSAAEKNCASQNGTYTAQQACSVSYSLGTCSIDTAKPEAYVIVFTGSQSSACASTQMGCETFAGGTFVPSGVCANTSNPSTPALIIGDVFQPAELVCRNPLEGEAPGLSDGKVCTRSMIGGCTEPGRRFADYAECSTVLTQRPYWPAPPNTEHTTNIGQRLADAGYMREVAWVKEQVQACGCVCCHSTQDSPNGQPSNWYIEAQPIWVDSFNNTGLALGAGWVDSSALGAYDPIDNHGFDRSVSGIPTTDNARMVRFFEQELARRGLTRDDFKDTPAFGGPLVDQREYTPTRCTNNQGVSSTQGVVWTTGGARYVYVLEKGSANPGVPPNLDLPEGTLWRIDVSPDKPALTATGFAYAQTPQGAFQKYPATGTPTALESGKEYYLYVLADVGIPVTRCLFEYR
jgi:hypothetical protein